VAWSTRITGDYVDDWMIGALLLLFGLFTLADRGFQKSPGSVGWISHTNPNFHVFISSHKCTKCGGVRGGEIGWGGGGRKGKRDGVRHFGPSIRIRDLFKILNEYTIDEDL
jgi:hypothetical protein